jgi:hypothetical protein
MATKAVDRGTRRVARSESRARRLLPWLAGLLLAIGIVAAIFAFGPNRNPPPERISNQPAQVPATAVAVPLPLAAKLVARRFVQTAVARRNLAEAYNLVGPNLRGGLTLKQWLTGNIPVVPYPAAALNVAPFKIDYAHRDDALLEVAMLPKKGAAIRGQVFYLGLKRIKGKGGASRWVVDNWIPRGSAPLPQSG